MKPAVRVRFAPSPTGHLHVGGARTALFNWLFARHHHGTFVLRIEDTDAERSNDVYTEALLDGLKWLGLDWDEGPGIGGSHGPYFQTQRMDLYRQEIQALLKQGKLYHCFCSSETLTTMREEQAAQKLPLRYDGRCKNLSAAEVAQRLEKGEKGVLRLRVPDNITVSWNDVTKGLLTFSSELLDDLVVVKSDGFPTYNFAVVVDDVSMQITHVIRGEDHISNTPKQILLYQAMEKPIPLFAHIPMILGADRSRLSKRHGATSVIDYKDLGFEPEAFRNYLAQLGWSSESGKEILNRQDMFEQFTLERVSSHGAIFDMEKLRWMNAEYIKIMSPERLLECVTPWLEKVAGYPGSYTKAELAKMTGLFRERIRTFNELSDKVTWFFCDPETYDEKGMEKARKTPNFIQVTEKLREELATTPDFSEGPLETLIRCLAESTGRKAGEVIHLCRLALTGQTISPGMFETMAVLGKPRCLDRLNRFVKHASKQ